MIHEADVPYSRSHQHHGGQYFQVRDQYIDNPGARQEQEAAGQRVISGEMEPYIVVRDVDVLDLGGAKVRVHHVPGHTAGSVAYEVVGHHAVFVGDEVQVHGAANGFPGYEDPMAYKQSLRYLIDEVQRQMLYLGHPYRTTEGGSIWGRVRRGANQSSVGRVTGYRTACPRCFEDCHRRWSDGHRIGVFAFRPCFGSDELC